jgi:serine/threonine-protein kinase
MENRILLDKYRVLLDPADMPIELRRTASSVTCKGEEIESGREVALDIVTIRDLSAETREKIEVEAAAVKQLNHVNIPVLYDFGFDGHDVIYATEFFDGDTAETWVTTNGPMPVRVVLRIALQVVSALAAATFQLVMHRAIHPGNILIVAGQTAEGEWPLIKVLNFGRIRPGTRKFGYGTIRDKSAPFASPEQLMHGKVDFRSEVYSLGCTLWSLLTGVSPFNAPGEPLGEAQMAPAMRRFRGVPTKVRRLITEMAATDPDNRPLDPVMMTERLQRCLASIERREAIARKLGIPITWQRRRVAKPLGPLAARPLAMAAIIVALAALAGVLLTKIAQPRSLWKRFTTRDEIGVPVGVAEPSVAPAATAQPKPSAPPSIATSDTVPPAQPSPSETKSNLPIAASPLPNVTPATSAAPVMASTNEVAAPPPQDHSPNEPRAKTILIPPPTEPMPVASPPIVAANSTPLPAEPPSPKVSPETSAAPRAELVEPPPATGSASRKQTKARDQQDKVPRAVLVAPPPPGEGAADVTAENSDTNAHESFSRNAEGVPRAELVEPPPSSSSHKTRRELPLSSSLTASERAAIRRASRHTRGRRTPVEGDGAMVRTPDGVVHGKFIGTTPDGQWMLALPSHRIMVVPPPPDFIPR